MNEPERMARSRTSPYSLEVATTVAPTLLAPATSCVSIDELAATATTPGMASAAMASASPSTSVDWTSPANPPGLRGRGRRARLDECQARAEAPDAVGDPLLRSLPHRHQRYDRADADDDAE